MRQIFISGCAWICFATACDFPRPTDVPGVAVDAATDVTVDAAADAPLDVSVAVSCTANEFIACDANGARICNATGDGTTTQDCGSSGCNPDARRCNQCLPNTDSCSMSVNKIDHCGSDGLLIGQDTCSIGCIATPVAHCAYIEPRYLPNACDALASMPTFTVTGSGNFDTNLDNNCTGGLVAQAGGPTICVVRYGSIQIAQFATLTVSGGRVLALVADTGVSVDGVLDISANGRTNGPGGGGVISGAKADFSTGGGGAGFMTAGGAGGSMDADGGGGVGGGSATDPSLLTVLVGGTRPANSGGPFSDGTAFSGGAGGAATLIACRGSVSIHGIVDAGGGGGQGGSDHLQGGQIEFTAGAGGGSGGNVVLQGVAIVVTGQVFANGGGGGAGNSMNDGAGQNGADGTLSATNSAPGGPPVGSEGAGGAGGRQGAPPGIGRKPAGFPSTPGGGGGSVGFFQTYTPVGVAPTLTPIAASPLFGSNKMINKR